MISYFNQEGLKKFRGRPRTKLVTTINEDIKVFEAKYQEAAAILEIAPVESFEIMFHLARNAAEKNA